MFDTFFNITEQYFNEMIEAKDAYMDIALGLKTRILDLIRNTQRSTSRCIEVILDNYKYDSKREINEARKKMFIDIFGVVIKAIKPNGYE
jgi:hypothetical protein